MFKVVFISLVSLLMSISSVAKALVIEDYPVDKISPSVHVIHGPTAIPNETSQGFMNNPGIIMTSEGVVVIDPGGVIEGAEMTLRVIKKLTDKPVVAVRTTRLVLIEIEPL